MGEVVGELAAPVVEDHEEQLVLRCEVPVEGGAGEAGLDEDVAHLRVDGAGALHHLVRRVDDAGDVLLGHSGRLHRPGGGGKVGLVRRIAPVALGRDMTPLNSR